jgi:hypothetical protein
MRISINFIFRPCRNHICILNTDKNPENHKLQTQKHKTKQIQIEPEDQLIKKE